MRGFRHWRWHLEGKDDGWARALGSDADERVDTRAHDRSGPKADELKRPQRPLEPGSFGESMQIGDRLAPAQKRHDVSFGLQ
jgi:hypothetical protein